MYHVVLVEDNVVDAEILRRHLERYAKETGFAYKLTWFRSATEFLDSAPPCDLIFLDIQMPGLDGMEAASLLRTYDSETPLIFLTALASYAIKGYEVDALDFAVKPLGYHDFVMRMRRAERIMRRNSGSTIHITTREALHVIHVADLAYVDITNHDLSFHVGGREPIVCRMTLREAESLLDPQVFTRISNSCIVNMGHVRRVLRDGFEMTSGETLYFSRSRKKQALEDIAGYLGSGA